MGELHSFPNAAEAIQAIREWLADEVVPATVGELSYHARVARHLLGIVARELETGRPEGWFATQLAELDVADDAALAAQITEGEWDGRESVLMRVLDRITDERLRIANPGWLEPVTDDDPRR